MDCPIFLEEYILRLGIIIPLTEFNSFTGATRYINKSHKTANKPDPKFFDKNCTLLEISPGSAWIFNTRLWHSGGINNSKSWRHALTLNICRPWMKQYIDIPRMLEQKDIRHLSKKAKIKLGYFSQPPTNYDEYFKSESERLFK